jgi:membrane peptidoglycan carboxypeptidase
MLEHNYITKEERDTAEAEVVAFTPPHTNSITAPHFVFYVQQYLQSKYGEQALEESGWSVITSLDANMQTKAEEIVQAHAESNEKNFKATNTGLIALDPKTGQILAMVGSRNYFDKTIDGNFNVTLAARQPGSSFKPFAYAESFIKGYTPSTVVFDVPTQFSTNCEPDNFTSKNGCYSPVNYDNDFRGPMTLKDALAQSINIPAVKVLYLAGIKDTLKLAQSMGISTLGDPNQYGLTLVLGGGEVTLLDISSAYGTFAQNGMHFDPVSVLQIQDANGATIEDNTQKTGSQVLPAPVAENINDMLSDPVARAPLGENNLLSFAGHDVAVKTGTTNNYKDAWTVGYTPNIVVGMWVGNNDNSSMVKKVSGFIVGPMWHEFMQYALTQLPNESFTLSESETSGLKPVLRGIWQTPGSDGMQHEILYWVNKSDPNGPPPINPGADPQFKYWDTPVQNWVAEHGVTPIPLDELGTSTTATTSPTDIPPVLPVLPTLNP